MGDLSQKLHPWSSLHDLEAAVQVWDISLQYLGWSESPPPETAYCFFDPGEGPTLWITQVSAFPNMSSLFTPRGSWTSSLPPKIMFQFAGNSIQHPICLDFVNNNKIEQLIPYLWIIVVNGIKYTACQHMKSMWLAVGWELRRWMPRGLLRICCEFSFFGIVCGILPCSLLSSVRMCVSVDCAILGYFICNL